MKDKQPRLQQSAGQWQIIHYADNGDRKVIHLGTHRIVDASARFYKFMEERGGEKTVPMLIRDYERERLDELANFGQRLSSLRMLELAFCDTVVSQLDASTINAFIAGRMSGAIAFAGREGRKVTLGGVRPDIVALKAVITHAVKQNRIDVRATPDINIPKNPQPRSLVMTKGEIETLIDDAYSIPCKWAFNFIMLLSQTACRRGAAESLLWSQVDMENRLINFGLGYEESSKKRPVVPINERLFKLLESIKGDRLPTDTVIGHPGGSMVYHFKMACKLAFSRTGNIKFQKASSHTMRHSWATNAARRGVPLAEIAAVLGDSVAVVSANYLHFQPDYLRSAMEG